jgi:hypothetical protein
MSGMDREKDFDDSSETESQETREKGRFSLTTACGGPLTYDHDNHQTLVHPNGKNNKSEVFGTQEKSLFP